MDEKEFLKKLKNPSDQGALPCSLYPGSIGRMPRVAGRRKRCFSAFRAIGLAAAFAIAIPGSWQAAEGGTPFRGTPAAADAADADGTAATTSLDPAGSYEAVYDALIKNFGPYGGPYSGPDVGMVDTAAVNGIASYAVAEDSASGAQNSQPAEGCSYSATNVQEAGVDEGDLVKTDGRYIYVLKRSGSLVVLSADGGSMETASVLTVPADETVQEMYLDGGRLSFITTYYKPEMDTSAEDVISYRSGMRTKLYTYDITDRKNPKLLGATEQDGSFSQSRKNGDYIYVFSSYSPLIMDTYGGSEIIPVTSRGPVDASEVYLPEHLSYSSYLVATSVNIQDPGKIADQKAVVSAPSSFYASRENIYIANEDWDSGNARTDLLKLHYGDGDITGVAVGTVEGYLNDSFSLNEYEGYLRAVTTSYDEDYNESNGLYIFDPNMRLTGAIRDLAPDETVRSARFLGDTGYFVTFRQTDPLFSVDLSDPEDPKVLGHLKVSGFSSYLHFYSDTLLLGLGYEADETNGSTTGLKLSMFDVSDPANVTEADKLVLPGITWCNSFDDYRSILMDPKKNVFGFSCNDRYLVFSYDEKQGFTRELLYDTFNDILDGLDGGSEYGAFIRGLYINDTFYLVRPGIVNAFDMSDGYRQIGRLQI